MRLLRPAASIRRSTDLKICPRSRHASGPPRASRPAWAAHFLSRPVVEPRARFAQSSRAQTRRQAPPLQKSAQPLNQTFSPASWNLPEVRIVAVYHGTRCTSAKQRRRARKPFHSFTCLPALPPPAPSSIITRLCVSQQKLTSCPRPKL